MTFMCVLWMRLLREIRYWLLLGVKGLWLEEVCILSYRQFMAIMVILFIILFSVSLAALCISSTQRDNLMWKAWKSVSNKTKEEVQNVGDCCGFNATYKNKTKDHPSCSGVFMITCFF